MELPNPGPNELLEAARSHNFNVDLVRLCLANGVNIHRRDKNRKSALHYAVDNASCDIDTLRELLICGANPNLTDSRRNTPLHTLLMNKNCSEEKVNLLLEHGADISLEDYHDNAALGIALLNPDIPACVIQKLLELGADVHKENDESMVPIQIAIESDCNLEVIRTLVTYGANVNAKHSDGTTILHEAIQKATNEESLQIISFLLDQGADINATTSGDTPLHTAVLGYCDFYTSPEGPLYALVQSMPKYTASKATSFVFKTIEELLKRGASVVLANKFGFTALDDALHLCAEDIPDQKLVKLLLRYTLLKNFKPDFRNLLHIDVHDLFKAYLDYFKACVAEVRRMKKEKLSKGLDLFDFVATAQTDEVVLAVAYQVLLSLHQYTYAIYKDFILSKLNRESLMRCVIKQEICVRRFDENEGMSVLDTACSTKIAKFLSRDDLLNYISVFQFSFRQNINTTAESEKESQRPPKRVAEGQKESQEVTPQPSKRVRLH